MIRYGFKLIVVLLVLLQTFSCDEESSQEGCAGHLCPYVGNWNLVEVFVDGNEVEDDYNTYRLNLLAPTNGGATSTYTRIYADGLNEDGTWEVSNNDDVLVLHNGDNETYIVESITQNSLIMVMNRETLKQGPEKIRLVLAK